MGLYSRYLLPHMVNWAMAREPMTKVRRTLIPWACGDVLEIGFGSGQNLPFYGADARTLVAVDPAEELRTLAAAREAAFPIPLRFVRGGAESLAFPDRSFDTVVCTWSLCTISDPDMALQEIRRVLKPNGALLFAEHVAAPDASVLLWQKRLNPVWKRVAGGCNLQRSTLQSIRAAGFRVDQLESGYLPGPRWATYTHIGRASIPA